MTQLATQDFLGYRGFCICLKIEKDSHYQFFKLLSGGKDGREHIFRNLQKSPSDCQPEYSILV